jgi:hypothetical protein
MRTRARIFTHTHTHTHTNTHTHAKMFVCVSITHVTDPCVVPMLLGTPRPRQPHEPAACMHACAVREQRCQRDLLNYPA